MECVFCNIVQGKSPATVEWEDEKVIAIRDAPSSDTFINYAERTFPQH